MSPFEAIYGQPPPSFPSYTAGSTNITTLETSLQNREDIPKALQITLTKGKRKMEVWSNKKCVYCTFVEGDLVWLKLQPYRQQSVVRRPSQKLAKRYFGSFKILRRIEKSAYQLELPPNSRIHLVFHVSQLQTFFG